MHGPGDASDGDTHDGLAPSPSPDPRVPPDAGWSTYGPATHRDRIRRWARHLGRRPGEWYGPGRPVEGAEPLVPRVVVVVVGLAVLVLVALIAVVLWIAPEPPAAPRSQVLTGSQAPPSPVVDVVFTHS